MRYDDLVGRGLQRIERGGLQDYLDLGTEPRSQNRINREYLDSLVFEMRILGSTSADTTTSLFGQKLSGPVVSSPLCASRVMNSVYAEPDYLLDIAAGLADSGSLMMTGNSNSTCSRALSSKAHPSLTSSIPTKTRISSSNILRKQRNSAVARSGST